MFFPLELFLPAWLIRDLKRWDTLAGTILQTGFGGLTGGLALAVTLTATLLFERRSSARRSLAALLPASRLTRFVTTRGPTTSRS